jgi:hypothetical protein
LRNRNDAKEMDLEDERAPAFGEGRPNDFWPKFGVSGPARIWLAEVNDEQKWACRACLPNNMPLANGRPLELATRTHMAFTL